MSKGYRVGSTDADKGVVYAALFSSARLYSRCSLYDGWLITRSDVDGPPIHDCPTSTAPRTDNASRRNGEESVWRLIDAADTAAGLGRRRQHPARPSRAERRLVGEKWTESDGRDGDWLNWASIDSMFALSDWSAVDDISTPHCQYTTTTTYFTWDAVKLTRHVQITAKLMLQIKIFEY